MNLYVQGIGVHPSSFGVSTTDLSDSLA